MSERGVEVGSGQRSLGTASWAAAYALAIGVFVSVGSASSAGAARPNFCNGDDCYFTRVSGEVTTGPGLLLHRTYYDTENSAKVRALACKDPDHPLPTDIAPSAQAPFCYERVVPKPYEIYVPASYQDSRVVFYYDILNDKGQQTGYFMDGYAFVPRVGKNDVTCTIRKSSDRTVDNSVYSCTTSWGSSNPHSADPQPHWSIKVQS
jgi:hypothetical protein